MKSLRIAGAFLIPVLLAAFLRFPQLAQRPMHCDEAVHADKFGILLEEGRYEYSTVDYHGPSLYYLTLLPARLQGATRYTDISEITLRSVPAVFGVLLVAAHAFLVPFVGLPAAAAAALLAALSPGMVYYSRYYIHEILLVFFSFCFLLSAFCYLRRRRFASAVATGTLLGLLYATKETWVISLACMSLAAILMLLVERLHGRPREFVRDLVCVRHVLVATVTAVLISVLLLSSFFSHLRGVTDSAVAFATYFERGTGTNTWHVHPWYSYFRWLLYYHSPGSPIWTEGVIVLLAVLGFLAGLSKSGVAGVNPRILRFLGYYTLLMALCYSAIPYKAPWNMLGFLHGMILLAGAGMAWLLRAFRKPAMRAAAVAICAAALIHLGWEAWAASFPYGADPCNPYVYAHTGKGVFTIVRQLEDLAWTYPDGSSMPIQIMSRENLWPLPWYLRRFSGVRWWDGVPEFAPNAPIILATPDMEPALIRKLYELPPPGERELYMNLFRERVELRPQVELGGYISKSLWDEYLQMEPKNFPSRR